MPVRARLLWEPQRDQIVEAIGKAGLDPGAFDLADDGVEFRIEHTLSASCFTIYRDATWRFHGTYFVGYSAERTFDRSWRTVIPLVGEWLAELKRDLYPPDL
jgi:hypothetical protein